MNEIQEISIADPQYPAAIKALNDAPRTLYYQGILPSPTEHCVAIVGTRRPSPYGQQAAIQITSELAEAGITVVSGLAPGIDTFAHRTSAEKRKRTIAVLGTGLDEKSIYPQENVSLARSIIEQGGCLISEYKPGTPGYPNNFRQRNRIVSALSKGVVVVEAKERSGSLITARLAKEQKKALFAVPGQIYTLNAKGPHKLIKEGATLIEGAKDILDVLGIESHFAKASRDFGDASPQELAILTALTQESLYIDKIIERTKLPAPIVGSQLALMEISGKVRNLGGNRYSIV